MSDSGLWGEAVRGWRQWGQGGGGGREAVGAGRQWKVPGEGYSGEEVCKQELYADGYGGSRNT